MSEVHLPPIPQSQMYIEEVMSLEWQGFFRDLLTRVGGIDHPNMDELSIDITGDIAAAILVHSNDTTNIHGIDDTEDLITSQLQGISKLIAPDGSPDPALHIDNDGKTVLLYGTGVNEFSIDGTLADNSDDAAPTEQAVKTYIDQVKTDFIDGPLSPQVLTGGVLSEGTLAGTFKVSALTALIRAEDSVTSALELISFAEQDNQIMPVADTTYKVILNRVDDVTFITVSETAPNYTTAITIGKVMKNSFDSWSKIVDPTVLPTGAGQGIIFNNDSSLMAVAHVNSPYVTVYNTDDYSKIDNPSVLPTGIGSGVAFSDDSSLMAVSHYTSPYVTVYNTDDWSKVADPAILPTGTARGVAFNNDSSLMAVAHSVSPYVTVYNTGDWSKVADPAILPTGAARGVAFSDDGSLMAVACIVSPYITIYNTSDWSKVADPAILPTGAGASVDFNHDSSLMAVAHYTSPYITIYNTGDWSKVADPAILPASTGLGVTFNHDNSSLAVAHTNSPYITIYNISDWSKVADPSDLPTGEARDVAFNNDSSSLVVAHYISPYVTIYNTSNVHFLHSGRHLADGVAKLHKRAQDLREIELCCGSLIAYSGTNNFTMEAGIAYAGINKLDLASYDSAAAAFTPIYRDGGGGWTEDTPRNTIDFAHYDDGSGVLGEVGNNKYGCHWVYRHSYDDHIYVVYGRGSYTLSEAETAPEPTRPDHLGNFGGLVGCIIAPKAGGSFTAIQMVTDTFFVGTNTSNHNNLGGLQGGTLDEYYHFTAAQHPLIASLVDNSIVNTLHRHSELVASDGDPDPALSIDATGLTSLVNGTGINEFSIDGTLVGNSDDAVPTEQAVKTYVDAISTALSAEIDADIATHAALANVHHAESHTITSHSDVVDATGANLEELTGGGDTILHDHDGISENTAARHTQGTDTALGVMAADINMNSLYQVVGLQAPAALGEAIRQTASITESNLNVLTDNSIADALHRHSELVASDGSPDPALSTDANGNVGIGIAAPTASGVEVNRTGAGAQFWAVRTDGATMEFSAAGSIGVIGTRTAHPVVLRYSSSEKLRLDSAEVIVNDPGLDVNFRVEGDTEANLLFCDAGTNNIGIGTNAPTEKLDINADAIRIRTAQTPASAGAVGTQGMICWDASYIYVCTATNTWKRVAIATW